jgi:predicted TIM-barrel fold metal-dependent hydrolase
MKHQEDTVQPVIDVCGTAYDEESWRANLLVFAERTPGYLAFFGGTFAVRAGVDPQAYAEALDSSPHRAVELLLSGGGLPVTAEEHVLELKRQGVRHQVLHGGAAELPNGETVNDRVAALAASQPATLSAWAGLDVTNPTAAVAEFHRCVEQLGMTGASVVHFAAAVDPLDPRCHELYGGAVELGVPLWVHTGMNLASNRPLESSTWAHIDQIAVAHPRLVLVAGHGGWPRVLDGMAVLMRHPNVYLDFSAHRPAVMGKPGSGWEPLFLYGRGALRSKVLFGSAGFVQQQSVRELADELVALDLDQRTTSAWLHDNSARLLGLTDD